MNNPNKDDTGKIADWVKKRELEDDIASKSKNRVARQMAQQIKQVKPLPVGHCNSCGSYQDKLIPQKIKLCSGCLNKFFKAGGPIKVLNREFVMTYCDWCLGKTFTIYTVNPLLCNKCSTKMGKKHFHDIKNMRKDRTRETQRLPWKRR